MSVPIRIDASWNRQPTIVPIVKERSGSIFGETSDTSPLWFDKSHDDDLFGRLGESLIRSRHSDSERWFDDLRRRFDERRRQWDAEIRELRSSFFNSSTFPLIRPGPGGTIPASFHLPASSNRDDCPVVTGYERGVDGNLHFLAQFDVRRFHQDDVHVAVRDGQIIVSAIAESRVGTSSTSKQVTRTIDLPKGSKEADITASINIHNTLLIDVPIGSNVQNLPFNRTHSSSGMSGITSTSNLSESKRSTQLLTTPTASFLSSHSKFNFHVEVPVGSDYHPEEIQIRTLNNRIYVNARHEEKQSNRSTFREFSKEYDIPEHIDPKTIIARLEHGILHLEGTLHSV